mgnify:CR=1 FL=1
MGNRYAISTDISLKKRQSLNVISCVNMLEHLINGHQ